MSEEQGGFDNDIQDQADAPETAAQARSAQGASQGAPRGIAAGSDNIVILPSGQTIDRLDVDGNDLVIVMADGTRIIVPDGAIAIPQLVIDGTPIPAANVAALLVGNEPEPAAGVNPSSGGNFAVDPGEIQSAFDLGDLLPYTELPQPQQVEEEIIPGRINQETEIVIETADNPVGLPDAIATVSEAGLPARGGGTKPAGTNSEADSETTTGTLVFNAPDGLAAVLINGVEITTVGQTFTSPIGVLTITSIDLSTGEIGFSYTVVDNALGEEFDDFFQATVVDTDGDEATATLKIEIADDAPIGINDSATVPAASLAPIMGNVLDNDISGADGFPVDGGVIGFSNANGAANPGEALQGTYGVLTLNADGTYTYVRDPNTPGGVDENFTYGIEDQDGSPSSAVLTITIENSPATITFVPEIGDGTVVDEAGLPPRAGKPAGTGEIADDIADNDSDTSETTSGAVTFNSPDGLASVSINGVTIDQGNLPQTVVADSTGTLVITSVTYDPVTGDGTVAYEYTLADNTSGDDTSVTFEITVTDLDGDTATDDLTITILDDEPSARDDTATAGPVEDAPVIVDVLANDTSGADGVTFSDVALVDGSLQGTGALIYNNDGTFTYTPAVGEEGEITFDYSITDGDGDVSTATVTITLAADSKPAIAVSGDNAVDEAGLPARGGEPQGSQSASDTEIAQGNIAITTGSDTLASLVINGQNVTAGGTVVTAKGELAISVVGGQYSYTYKLTDNTLSDPDSDSFNLVVTDSDGDIASTSLVIAIVDDAPSAQDDAATLGAGEFGPIGGNVLANDTQGADAAIVTTYSGTGGSGAAGAVVQGTYGTLTIAANGTFSYTRDANASGSGTDTFTYTIIDGDGDTATANLLITLANSLTSLTLPVAGEDGTIVDEAGLDGPVPGSAAASNAEFTSGTFTFTAPDGPAIVTIDGVVVTGVGQTFTGSFGTLTIDAVSNGAIEYTYELTTNTAGDTTSDGFTVVVTDQDGDFSDGTLAIQIIDDVPLANPDFDSVTEDGPLVATGNVITGVDVAPDDANATDGTADVHGADDASVTGVTAGPAAGEVVGNVGTAIAGAYGSITILANGDYIYQVDNTNAAVQGLDQTEALSDLFSYTITDVDGDTSTTTVTLTINGADDPVVLSGFNIDGAEEIVDEDDLPDGSSPDAAALTQAGTFNLTSVDGLDTLSIDGNPIFGSGVTYPVSITGAYGALKITGVVTTLDADGDVIAATVSYEYTLSSNTEAHSLAGEDRVTDSFTVEATDTDGSVDSDVLNIDIVDDVPTAVADSGSVAEGGTIDFADSTSVLANDEGGADGIGSIVGVRADGDPADVTSDVTGGVGLAIAGDYGTLTLLADGTYRYEADADSIDASASDVFVYTIVDGDGDLATTTLTINLSAVTLVGDDDDVAVFEAALDLVADDRGPVGTSLGDDLAPGNVTGSNPASDGETVTGQLAVTGGVGTVTYAINGSAVGNYGQIQINVDGSYTYTLTDAVDGDSLVPGQGGDNGANVYDNVESFSYTATDAEGNTVTGTITVDVTDDVPTAVADSDSVAEGGTIDFADSTSVLANDEGGADGIGSIVGVRADGDPADVTSDVTGGVGLAIAGDYGTLTLLADGTYRYEADADSIDTAASDVFVYTIVDGDGDLATTTLTINLSAVTLVGDDDDVAVFEAALDLVADDRGPVGTSLGDDLAPGNVTGSNPASDGETVTGQLAVTGGVGTVTYAINGSAVGNYGQIQINADGSYTYTLTDAVDGDSLVPGQGGDNGANVYDNVESFSYTATDAEGNTVTGTITVDVTDDVPTAVADSDSVAEGGTIDFADSTSVLANDEGGADGIGSIVGVRADGDPADVTSDVTGGVGLAIAGDYGTLTLLADGTYRYEADADSIDASASDVFVYTIVDGDGDLATTTLTINLSAVTLVGDDDDVAVFEAALDLVADDRGPVGTSLGDDLAPGNVTGSNPASDGETVTGQLAVTGGVGTVTYAINGSAVGNYGQIQINADGSYTYTLTDAVDGDSLVPGQGGDNGANVYDNVESFSYTATDAEGNTVTGTITVDVTDDVPTAVADSDSVAEGGTIDFADSTSVLANDEGGADGIGSIVGVRADGDPADVTSDVTGGVGLAIAGDYGTLTLLADGTYRYEADADSIDTAASDVFVYTIVDGDGDLATTTLTINLSAVTLVGDDDDVAVFEAALDLVADDRGPVGTSLGDDLAPGNVTGSNPASDGETVTGQLAVTGGVGTVTYAINGSAVGTYGQIQINTDGSYTYTLTDAVDGDSLVPGQGGDNGANVYDNIESFSYSATDAEGNTVTGTITVDVTDDVPMALAPANAMVTNTAGSMSLLASLDTIDGDVSDNYGADGPGAVIFTAASITALEGQGLQSGFSDLEYTTSGGGTVLIATKVSDSSEVFRIELQPTGGANQYQVTIAQPLDSTSVIDFNGGNYNFVGGNNSWNGFVAAGETLGGTTIDNQSQDLLLTPAAGGAPGSSVNTTANIGGIGNTFVGSQSGGETFRVDFVTDLRGDTADTVGGQNYAAPANRDHVFDGHYLVNGATALFKSTSGSTVRITAFDDPDGNLVVGDGVIDAISGVTIAYKGIGFGSIITPTSTPTDYTVNGQVFTVTLNADGSVSIAGVDGNSGASLEGTVIGVLTETGYNSVEYSWEAGSTFQIGDFGATTITNDPVDFSVPISIVDGDGDITDAGTLAITATPGSPPVLLDLDGDGVEVLGLDAGVAYDMDGDGILESTAWVGSDDGILVHDADGNGTVSGADEFVFGSGSLTDLAAVAANFDENGDGLLDANDAAFASFGVWQDADSDGVTDAGEFATLEALGITSINLVSDGAGEVVAGGDATVHGNSSFTWADGSIGKLADVSFRLGAEQRAADLAVGAAAMAGFIAAMPMAAAATEFPAAAAAYRPLGDDPVDLSVLPLGSNGAERVTGENTQFDIEANSADENKRYDGTPPQQAADISSAEIGVSSEGQSAPEFAQESDGFVVEPAVFSFAEAGLSASAMMEALLIIGEGGESADVAAVSDADAVRETILDVVAEGAVDALVEAYDGPENGDQPEVVEILANQMSEFLGHNISGAQMITAPSINEVSMDEGGELALMHG